MQRCTKILPCFCINYLLSSDKKTANYKLLFSKLGNIYLLSVMPQSECESDNHRQVICALKSQIELSLEATFLPSKP